MVLRLLKDVFQQEEYRELLIAAYCPGWRVTEKDLEEAPWLKMAQGETDLGVDVYKRQTLSKGSLPRP